MLVNGGWSQWTKWSLCDKPCNSGLGKRLRFCDSPKPKYDGEECTGESEEVRVCNTHACKSKQCYCFSSYFHPKTKNRDDLTKVVRDLKGFLAHATKFSLCYPHIIG